MAHEAEAKASLCSRTSMSSIDSPLLWSSVSIAGIGAFITLSGSTPAVVKSEILASTGRSCLSAVSIEAIRTAEAPSET